MKILKITLRNPDGSPVNHEQLVERYGAENVKRHDSALVESLPDGELTPEQVEVVLAAVKPQGEEARDD